MKQKVMGKRLFVRSKKQKIVGTTSGESGMKV